MSSISSLFEGKYYELGESYKVVDVLGPDAHRFLNGQLTNDIDELTDGTFQLQSRLDRSGRIVAFFYLVRINSTSFKLIVPSESFDLLLMDLNKYIIMDDVELLEASESYIVNFTASIFEKDFNASGFTGIIASYPVLLSKTLISPSHEKLNQEEFETLLTIQGSPTGTNTNLNQLVTDTLVFEDGVSLKKGCFLGQETVAKIETRKGAAYKPVLLETSDINFDPNSENQKVLIGDRKVGTFLNVFRKEEKSLIYVTLLRDYRILNKTFKFSLGENSFEASVKYLPYFGQFELSSYIDELFEKAVKSFQEGREEEAIDLFLKILKFDPKNEDTLESMGVIFGRQEKYEEGLALMDRVLEVNPDSVMAHTNKSFFYMRLGNIEAAEEEKSQATVKSFGLYGKEAERKRIEEELKEKKRAEVKKRKEMFLEVLTIDPEDALANYGLADISFLDEEYSSAEKYLEKVLNVDDKYSVAYLLLGKTYRELGQKENAISTLEKGIEIASKKGDLMPANEMQSILGTLK